ncbi:hypothetical protein [Geothrix sp. 21YS21S-2]|uniref:hypothetical protein n=1 Tax=Geothrix sp. 21YS21S-2 TaxID=3068893 RepID=UPI0027B9E9BA|nr:hypothetical protein [Geothrix sp. 21YS21S-2]
MNFQPYRETPYRDWTIQHTWRTSQERPVPDGFDRVAVKGTQKVAQDLHQTWAEFTAALDALDGLRAPRATTTPLTSGARPKEAAPGKPPPRRRRDPDPSLQSLFDLPT